MSKNDYFKECYCRTCDRFFHYLGIARHRSMHRDRKENCTITYTNGDTYIHEFQDKDNAQIPDSADAS